MTDEVPVRRVGDIIATLAGAVGLWTLMLAVGIAFFVEEVWASYVAIAMFPVVGLIFLYGEFCGREIISFSKRKRTLVLRQFTREYVVYWSKSSGVSVRLALVLIRVPLFILAAAWIGLWFGLP